jgi:hypothetical protein
VQLPSYGPNSIAQFIHANKLKTNSAVIFNQAALLAIKFARTLLQTTANSLVSTLEANPAL